MNINKIQNTIFTNNKTINRVQTKDSPQADKNYSDFLSVPTIGYWVEVHKPKLDELEDIKTLTLKNNIILNLDKNSPENKIAFKIHTKSTQKIKAKQAVKELYNRILDDLYIQINENGKIGNCCKNAELIEISGDFDNEIFLFPELFKMALQKTYNSDFFTKEQLEDAKESVLYYFEDEQQQDDLLKHIYHPEPYTKEDIKNVTLEDIKKYNNDLLSNSTTVCSISLPKNTNEATIKQITDIIEKQIPNQKLFDTKAVSKSFMENEKTTYIYGEEPTVFNKENVRFYPIDDDNTLKSSAMYSLICRILKTIMLKDESQNTKDLRCICSKNYLHKYLEIFTASNNKQTDIENPVNMAIKSITQGQLDNNFLNEAKQIVLNNRKEALEKSQTRAELISEIYDKGSYGLKEFNKELNSITPQEIQQKAQEIFSRPYIEEIREQKQIF